MILQNTNIVVVSRIVARTGSEKMCVPHETSESAWYATDAGVRRPKSELRVKAVTVEEDEHSSL